MKPLITHRSRVVPLLVDNVDTDQIIPARFLKVTDKASLADGLFADWRRDPGFVLNQPEHAGAEVLLCGHNFGCGSSREHAPWALMASGFRVLISTGFADIFRSNALGNGVLTVEVNADVHQALRAAYEANPGLEVATDVEAQTIRFGDVEAPFPLDGFAKHRLLEGVDSFDYLYRFMPEIRAFEEARRV
jgi:3-isopropylmalate/(R)-2-methylmalate dehydratase small subunit